MLNKIISFIFGIIILCAIYIGVVYFFLGSASEKATIKKIFTKYDTSSTEGEVLLYLEMGLEKKAGAILAQNGKISVQDLMGYWYYMDSSIKPHITTEQWMKLKAFWLAYAVTNRKNQPIQPKEPIWSRKPKNQQQIEKSFKYVIQEMKIKCENKHPDYDIYECKDFTYKENGDNKWIKYLVGHLNCEPYELGGEIYLKCLKNKNIDSDTCYEYYFIDNAWCPDNHSIEMLGSES